jgi:4-hydroxybenzoate polyprenyltransferase
MVDRDDDLKIGIKSTAILFGRHPEGWAFCVFVLNIQTCFFALSLSAEIPNPRIYHASSW